MYFEVEFLDIWVEETDYHDQRKKCQWNHIKSSKRYYQWVNIDAMSSCDDVFNIVLNTVFEYSKTDHELEMCVRKYDEIETLFTI